MEGKGWFVVYGALFILIGTIFVMVSGMNSRLNKLESAQVSPLTTVSPTGTGESDSPEPTPDLSTPEKRDAARKAALIETAKALHAYQSAKGSYPNSRDELVSDYLSAVPVDPLSPKFTYRYAKVGSGFRLTAFLESKNDVDDAKDGKKDQVYTVTQATPT